MDNPQAFPMIGIETEEDGKTYSYEDAKGMTLRDYFAGQALAILGSRINRYCGTKYFTKKDIVKLCYEVSDAMLKARTEVNGE